MGKKKDGTIPRKPGRPRSMLWGVLEKTLSERPNLSNDDLRTMHRKLWWSVSNPLTTVRRVREELGIVVISRNPWQVSLNGFVQPIPTNRADDAEPFEHPLSRADYRLYKVLMVIAEKPQVSVAEVSRVLGYSGTRTALLVQKARNTLGVKPMSTSVFVDAKHYATTCRSLGVEPKFIPADGRIDYDRKLRTMPSASPDAVQALSAEAMLAAFDADGVSHLRAKSLLKRVEQVSAGAALPPVLLPEPVAAVPAPVAAVPEPVAVPEQSTAAVPEDALIPLLRSLTEVMRMSGVTQITVNDDGSVGMQRRVVMTSTMTLAG